jgi:hypothetical protein
VNHHRTILAASLCVLISGCNRYELFNLAGYEQAAFNNEAELVFIVDNSSSMTEESEDLGLNFNTFIETLTSADGSGQITETLSDAVDNYISYTQQRGRFLDYQIGVTSTSVDYSAGATTNVDPGEAGLLFGEPTIIHKDDVNVATTFRQLALCEATCWSGADIPSDSGYECGTELTSGVVEEFLDCECGFAAWEGLTHCGSGQEEHLEAALLTLCRSVEDPPDVCFDANTPFTTADVDTNGSLLREGSTVVFVVVTDEGDTSRRLAQGDGDISVYMDAIASFGLRVRFAVIGPNWDPDVGDGGCIGGATTWGVERLRDAAKLTGGFYNFISEPDATGESCEPTAFADHLTELGSLLMNLVTAFQLQSIPDVSTIQAYIDDEKVPPAPLVDGELGTESAIFGDGWSYDPSQNAVVFWGSWIPDYNTDVQIFYRPVEGKPRELPF